MATDETTATASGFVAEQIAQPGETNQPATNNLGPDSRLADIAAKKARGEKLSASERGYLGSQIKRQRPKVADPVDSNPLLIQPTEAPADNPLFAGTAQPQTAANSPAATPVDSALIRRTAEGILTSVDEITQSIIGGQVKNIGADAKTVEHWKDAVAMKQAKPLMVEGSEPIILFLCEKFGCSPEELAGKLKGAGFVGGAALWLVGIGTAVKGLKELQLERANQPQPQPKP